MLCTISLGIAPDSAPGVKTVRGTEHPFFSTSGLT